MKDQCIGMNVNHKVRVKTQQLSLDVLSNENLQELTVLVHSNQDDNASYYLKKVLLRIITS